MEITDREKDRYFIICIDDDEVFLDSMSAVLPKKLSGLFPEFDHRFEFISNADSFFKVVRDLKKEGEKIALIISDQKMPDMTGIRLFEEVRRELPDTMRMLLTGYAGLESAKYAINNNILDQYVSKPIEDFDLFIFNVGNLVKKFHLQIVAELARTYTESIISNMNDMLIEISLSNLLIRNVNNAVSKILGYETEELKNESVNKIICESAYSRSLDATIHDSLFIDETLFYTHGAENIEMVFCAKDGRKIPVLCSFARMETSGRRKGIICVAKDITERKHMEQELRQKNTLLASLNSIQLQFIADITSSKIVFETMLNEFLTLTESKFGFIAEVLHMEEGSPYLKGLAISNIAWDEETRRLYERHLASGMEFYNMNNLFGAVILSGQPVISNDPPHDERSGGVPSGHPSINSFLGLPIYRGNVLLGVIGLANRLGGYDENNIIFLDSLLCTCANMMEAINNEKKRKQTESELIDRVHYANLVAEVGVSLTRGGNIRAILKETTEAIVRHLNVALARIWTIGEKENILDLQASSGKYTDIEGRSKHIPIGHCNVGLVASERKARHTNNLIGDPNLSDQEWVRNEGLTAFAGYPLIVEDELVGVMAMFSKEAFKDSTLNVIGSIADEISIGIKRLQTEEKLSGYRKNLEILVEERTKKLSETVKTLNEEIAERTKLLNVVNTAKEVAESANRAKSDFLANMSHELRTPLNSIIGFSDVLLKGMGGEFGESTRDLVNEINTSGNHLLSLINDILDLSKVEAGKMQLDMGEIDLRNLTEKVIRMFREKAIKHRIDLTIDTQDDFGIINADERKLKQILFNLVGNALKFTPDGGRVTVLLGWFTDKKDFIRISVEDTGIGISVEDQKLLFQPFTQLGGPTLTKKYQGTGLGLVLTKQMVELHKGRIWAESEPGKGSRFTFIIPKKQEVPEYGEI